MPTPSASLLLFTIAALVAVAGQLFVLRDALTGRTPAATQTSAGRARELLWIALPALALVLLVIATWRALPGHRADLVPTRHAPIVPDVAPRAAPLTPAGG